jgi:cytochrome c
MAARFGRWRSPDGRFARSGSFDPVGDPVVAGDAGGASRAALHDGAVNAAAALPDGRFVTAGEDGRLAIWDARPDGAGQVIAAHAGPVVGLAVSPTAGSSPRRHGTGPRGSRRSTAAARAS